LPFADLRIFAGIARQPQPLVNLTTALQWTWRARTMLISADPSHPAARGNCPPKPATFQGER
jgi:hypothetical protein